MDDEQKSPVTVEDRLSSYFSGEPDAPQADEPQAAAETQAEDAPTDDAPVAEAEQPEAGDSDGLEEIDIGGEKYRVPPKLKESFLRQEDYTRKTQEVAEQRRQIIAVQQAQQMEAQFRQATAAEYQQLAQVDAQIAQYRNLDWANLSTEQHLEARRQMDTLKEQREQATRSLGAKAQQFQQWHREQQQTMLQNGMEYLRKAIPKFDAEVVSGVKNYALGEGYTAPEIDAVNDPRFVKLLWKAQQFDAIKAGTGKAVSQVAKAPPVIRPGASQGQGQVTQNRIKADRDRLRKTGNVDDAARLFERMFKK